MSKVSALAWGQCRQWRMHHLLPAEERWRRNSFVHWPVPDGATPGAVRIAVDALVARHEALRSKYRLDDQGRRVQCVNPAAEVPIELHDLSGADDPHAAGEEIARKLYRRPFQLDGEPPLRVAAATVGTAVRWLFLVIHHIAADNLGLALLRRELQSVLWEVAGGRLPPVGADVPEQPADEVAYERTDRVRRASEASLEYWRDIVSEAPLVTLPVVPPGDPAPESGEWSVASPPAAVACQAIARRHGVHEPVVLLALFTLVLWGYTGCDRQLVELTASNRYEPGRMRVVTSLTLPFYTIISGLGPGMRFSELLQRAKKATMKAYRLGRYDEDAVAELLARESYERGANLTSVPIFNYLSTDAPHASTGAQSEADGGPLADDLESAQLSWSTVTAGAPDAIALRARRDGAALSISLRHKQAVIPATNAELLLRAMLRSLSVASQGDDPEIGKLYDAAEGPVTTRGSDWCRVRDSWMSKSVTASVLTSHPTVTAVAVNDGPQGVRAHVRTVSGSVTAVELRSHLVGHLAYAPAAGVPDAFVIHSGDAADPPDTWWWQRKDDVVEVGDGRDATQPEPAPEVRALQDAFARTHPDASGGWTAVPYLAAGGRIAAIGPLLKELASAGYHGLDSSHFLGFYPLSGLAAMLRPREVT